jgi:hypothetical protein
MKVASVGNSLLLLLLLGPTIWQIKCIIVNKEGPPSSPSFPISDDRRDEDEIWRVATPRRRC